MAAAAATVADSHSGDGDAEGPPIPGPGSAAFAAMRTAYETSIAPVFEEKCSVCHSSASAGPWMYRATGVRKKALRHLDLAGGFPFDGRGTADQRIQGIANTIRDGSMPPYMRRLTKPSSRISDDERKLILAWIARKPALSRTGSGAPAE